MVEIDIQIRCQTPLNIGSGAQHGTLADRGMIKTLDGWPYIPASALKGKWRHAAEQIAATLPQAGPVYSPHQTQHHHQSGMISHLFGSAWQPGKIPFVKLELTGPTEIAAIREKQKGQRFPRTQQRMGVSINRHRRVAEDALLYSTELFWPGIELQFGNTMHADISQSEAGLLLAGLKLMPALGRGKTGGLGWIHAAITFRQAGQVWAEDSLLTALQEMEVE